MIRNLAYLAAGVTFGIVALRSGIILIMSPQPSAILFGILAVVIGVFFLLLGIAGVVLEFRKHQL
jgi:uncharacterized membrane protein HdeD (DUF308 family)